MDDGEQEVPSPLTYSPAPDPSPAGEHTTPSPTPVFLADESLAARRSQELKVDTTHRRVTMGSATEMVHRPANHSPPDSKRVSIRTPLTMEEALQLSNDLHRPHHHGAVSSTNNLSDFNRRRSQAFTGARRTASSKSYTVDADPSLHFQHHQPQQPGSRRSSHKSYSMEEPSSAASSSRQTLTATKLALMRLSDAERSIQNMEADIMVGLNADARRSSSKGVTLAHILGMDHQHHPRGSTRRSTRVEPIDSHGNLEARLQQDSARRSTRHSVAPAPSTGRRRSSVMTEPISEAGMILDDSDSHSVPSGNAVKFLGE